ncbi:hypothetical protein LUW75_24210 [Streptomyces sp. MRC013]|uniref:hypothetical protein n=1 Tax=Streptomyces sp. MRC013 TaxID=2898276 RepID=UPI0020267C09|nr:hypothetical protein [Streptomyces sp. MRC013]URM88680.1 hypothetical protein LUW75_00010 [Streptomyces sp. MRC013]URM92540.1 hypothetical protein LUW75_24210 [Streptomyces sp. MRC013]
MAHWCLSALVAIPSRSIVYVLAVLALLALAGIAIGRIAYQNPALGTAMATATTVLALIYTVLQS